MRICSIVVFVAVLVACGVGACAVEYATEYEAIDLGGVHGWGGEAYGINDNGQIVGWKSVPGMGHHAFTWENGTVTDLASYGLNIREAYDINNHGQVVGTAISGTNWWQGVMWDSTNGFTILCPTTDCSMIPYAINDMGQVVGSTSYQRMGAFIWDSQNGVRSLGTVDPPSGSNSMPSRAVDISESGQVAGYYDTAPSTNFVWDAENGFREIGSIDDMGRVRAINDNGLIAGTGIRNLMVYDLNSNVLRDCGTIYHGYAVVEGINNAGQVVGHIDDTSISYHNKIYAYLWDEANGMRLLPKPRYCTRYWAMDINEQGWIVGAGESDQYGPHAILWRPVPEPSSLAVLFCGMGSFCGALLMRRK